MRAKFKVMSLTDAAAEKVRAIMESATPPLAGVRVGVKNSGCAGMAYTLDPVETPNPADDVVSEKGATIFIDPKAMLFLLGSTMDHRVTKLSAGFVFDNPNEVSACGCGESVQLKPADAGAVGRG
ncbi:MAG: HesB/IscA family protein [Bauldia sp.]